MLRGCETLLEGRSSQAAKERWLDLRAHDQIQKKTNTDQDYQIPIQDFPNDRIGRLVADVTVSQLIIFKNLMLFIVKLN